MQRKAELKWQVATSGDATRKPRTMDSSTVGGIVMGSLQVQGSLKEP